MNAERHAAVEALDDELVACIPMDPGAELHSETPGMITDRLSVAGLRLHHTRVAAADDPSLAARIPVVEEQAADLRAALARLLHGCAAGSRRFKTYRELKLYGRPSASPELSESSST
jgi:hypothetical protein